MLKLSEKRFTLNDKGIFDNQTKEQFNLIAWDWIECDIEEIVEKLNELADENEQLRQSIEHMISKATEISNRNVLLHEEIGRQTRLNKELQQKLDWICEQTGYDGAKFHHLEK